MLYHGRQARQPLEVIVVGGGIAGLASAFAIAKAGHKVIVLEATPDSDEGVQPEMSDGGVVHISSNGLVLLQEWGVGEKLREGGFEPKGVKFHTYDDDIAVLQSIGFEELLEDCGAPLLIQSHEKVHTTLTNLARSALGVQILYSKRVTSFDTADNKVVCEDGSEYSADLIVGADGAYGVIRQTVYPQPEDRRNAYYASVVTLHPDIDEGSVLADVVRQGYLNIWKRKHEHIWCCPLDKGSNMAITFHHEPQSSTTEGSEERRPDTHIPWHPTEIHAELSDWCTTAQHLRSYIKFTPTASQPLSQPPKAFHWPAEDDLSDDDEESLVDNPRLTPEPSTHVVLVGHAAHAIPPGAVVALPMAIGDAFVLGTLLSHYDPTYQPLPSLLSAYTSIRLPRSLEVASCHELYSIEDSGEALMEFVRLWAYHAGEAAEEWWALWRLPMERCEGHGLDVESDMESLGVDIEVDVEVVAS